MQLSKKYLKQKKAELKKIRRGLKPKNSMERQASQQKLNATSSEETDAENQSASSFMSNIRSDTSMSDNSHGSMRSNSEEDDKNTVKIKAIRKRMRRYHP